ncbi:MAG: hypothetical protein HY063_14335 [Bacteroidetes bacterium]|nr:hypothetical protein [Bacteroidota bacterium]
MQTTFEELEQLFKIKDNRQIKRGLVNKITALDSKNVQVTDEALKELLARFRNNGAYDVAEASKAYNVTEETMLHFARHKIISSYQLVSAAGSKVLFLKSELEKENHLLLTHSQADRMKIARLADHLARVLYKEKEMQPRNYLMLRMYYFEDISREQIANKYSLTPERVRQIIAKTERRMLYAVQRVLHGIKKYEEYDKQNTELRDKNSHLKYQYSVLEEKFNKLKSKTSKPSVKRADKILLTKILDSSFSDEVKARCLVHDINSIQELSTHTKYSLSYRGFDEKEITEVESFFKKSNIPFRAK